MKRITELDSKTFFVVVKDSEDQLWCVIDWPSWGIVVRHIVTDQDLITMTYEKARILITEARQLHPHYWTGPKLLDEARDFLGGAVLIPTSLKIVRYTTTAQYVSSRLVTGGSK